MEYWADIDRLARRQAGRITWAQLLRLGISKGSIQWLIASGALIPVLPKVYAVGHLAPSHDAHLWEAVLYAGPGAMLSHATAAHHRGLINFPPRVLHVSTPRKVASLSAVEPDPDLSPGTYLHPAVQVHARRRHLIRDTSGSVPTTDLAQTVLDLAATRPDLVQHALGQLDFQKILDPEQLRAATGPGNHGSTTLEHALVSYDPNWVKLKSQAEVDFYAFCKEWGVSPLPEPNFQLTDDIEVDGYWHDEKLVAEVDGGDAHSSAAQRLHDRNRDMACRALGLTVVRYAPVQFRTDPAGVYADITAQLRQRAR